MRKNLKEIISKRIIYLRKEQDLKMEQLAYQSGISKGGLSEIEHSKKLPNLCTISKICAGLGISLCKFFNNIAFDDYVDGL